MEAEKKPRLKKGILIALFFLNLILGVMGSIQGLAGVSTMDTIYYSHFWFYLVLRISCLLGILFAVALLFSREKRQAIQLLALSRGNLPVLVSQYRRLS